MDMNFRGPLLLLLLPLMLLLPLLLLLLPLLLLLLPLLLLMLLPASPGPQTLDRGP